METTWRLNDQLQTWLGEKNVADTLTQSVPTCDVGEWGWRSWDVADVNPPASGRGGLSAAG